MQIVKGCLTFIQFVITLAALVLIFYIAYFNVIEYRRVLEGIGMGAEIAMWVGGALFGLIQAMEIRPILLKHLHNTSAEMISFAEKQGGEGKLLAQQLKEEHQIRPRKIRRATLFAYLFTAIDLVLCVFLLFTPIIKPGVSILTVLLTMGLGLIVWTNVGKTLGTVWLLPLLTKMLVTESQETGLPNLSLARTFAALKAKLQAKTESVKAPQSAPMRQAQPPSTQLHPSMQAVFQASEPKQEATQNGKTPVNIS